MKKKKQHRIISLKEMFAYILRRDEPGVRHRRERQMQQDRFMEDAMEGLSLLDEQKAARIVDTLNQRISGTQTNPMRMWYTGIAAGLALLLISGISLLLLDNNKPGQFAQEHQIVEEIAEEIHEIPAVTEDLLNSNTEKMLAAPPPVLMQAKETPQRSSPTPSTASEEIIMEWEMAELPVFAQTEISLAEAVVKEDTGRIFIQETSGARAPSANETIMIRGISSTPAASNGTRKIAGTIVDPGGYGIPGVTLNIVGTTRGTVTDIDGRFEIEVPQNENLRLRASYIGMTNVEMLAQDFNNRTTIMQDDVASLSEVVVIGYGSRRRSVTSGSTSSVSENSYQPAQPVAGFEEYGKYLQSKALLPDSVPYPTLTVKVRAEISGRGRIINLNVLTEASPFDQRAIDIISSGPEWKAAQRGGNSTNENVIIDVEFRKKNN
jgi:hypothetical protein